MIPPDGWSPGDTEAAPEATPQTPDTQQQATVAPRPKQSSPGEQATQSKQDVAGHPAPTNVAAPPKTASPPNTTDAATVQQPKRPAAPPLPNEAAPSGPPIPPPLPKERPAAKQAGTTAAAGLMPVANPGGIDLANAAETLSESSTGSAVSADAAMADVAMPGDWLSPTEALWRKWLLFGGLPVAGLIVVAGLWMVLGGSSPPDSSPAATTEQPDVSQPTEQPQDPATETETEPAHLDLRWLPEQTTALASFRPSRLTGDTRAADLIERFYPAWDTMAGSALRSFNLKLTGLRRLTIAGTDLRRWPEQVVLIIEPADGHAIEALTSLGEPCGFALAGVACQKRTAGGWTHPFAVLDDRTIVTGDESLLRALANRNEAELPSGPVGHLLSVTPEDADLRLLVDLDAARRAGVRLPVDLFDVWPTGRQPWQTLWEMPDALGLSARWTEQLQTELALLCEGETAAEKVGKALEEFLQASKKALADQLATLPGQLAGGEFTVDVHKNYEALLKSTLAACTTARWSLSGDTVWLRTGWTEGPTTLATAALGGQTAVRGQWLAAAREADEIVHRRLNKAFEGYQKAEKHWPSAVAGGALLSPETRLSWVTTMLPYLGHADWQHELQTGYAWNSAKNRTVTSRALPEVVNPALGPQTTEADFPVTHYVGVAGVGPDAGRLPEDDPRAGVFGYGRKTRPEDIADGAANTVALLGVQEKLGPWGRGGEATTRALTQRPYINGPDGFGSGQPDGMIASMADGSVRFISKDVDPRVLEQLATIHGGEDVTVAALGRDQESTEDVPNVARDNGEQDNVPGNDPKGPEANETAAGDHPASDDDDDVPDKPPPGVSQPPLTQIDVAARLADRVPGIDFPGVQLTKALALVSAISTLPITLDTDAMQLRGVTPRSPVTLRIVDADVAEVLRQITASQDLTYVVDDDQVLVTTPIAAQDKMHRVSYAVGDLTGDDNRQRAALAATIQRLVAPPSWRTGGGAGAIETSGGVLSVWQTQSIQEQVQAFLERLRYARHLKLQTPNGEKRYGVPPHWARGQKMLKRPITLNFYEAAPLSTIVLYLQELAKADLLINRLELRRLGYSDQLQTSLTVDKQPLVEVLDEWLRPLDLDYRVVDEQTLEITTHKALAARLELEFYPIRKLLTGGTTADDLVERLKSQVAGSSWSDAGGPGEIQVDGPSATLIVLQSQPIQRQIERWLAQQAEGRD